MSSTCYCVVRTFDLRLLYLGTDAQAAAAVTDAGAICAQAATLGDAQRSAVIEAVRVGRLRQANFKRRGKE